MKDTYVCSGWACTDCLILLANGDTPPDMSETEIAEWAADIERRNAGYAITLGMSRELHSCLDNEGMTAGDNGNECECETQTFSWSPCDVCNSNLGGSRHAVSFFKIDWRVISHDLLGHSPDER